MQINIKRMEPESKKTWIQTYEVDTSKQSMTVMDVLEYIQNEIDHSLAFYRHSTCNHGICGRCTVVVNGRVRLACVELADQYETMDLEPVPNRKVVRDLVVE